MHFLRGSIQSQLFLFTDEWEFALLHLLLEIKAASLCLKQHGRKEKPF